MSDSPNQVNTPPQTLHSDISTRDPLPMEIFLEVMSNLDLPDLSTCLSLSRTCYQALLPLVYRTTSIDLSRATNPILTTRRPVLKPSSGLGDSFRSLVLRKKEENQYEIKIKDMEARRAEEERDKGIRRGRGTSGSSSEASKWISWRQKRSPLLLLNSLDNLPLPSECITHLTISSHTTEVCDTLDSLLIPNLITLQIIPDTKSHWMGIYQCHGSSGHLSSCPTDRICHCPLISRLTPRRLILGSESVGATRIVGGLWDPLPDSPPVWLKELVIHAGAVGGMDTGLLAERRTGGKFEKVTIIFQDAGSEEKMGDEGDELEDWLEEHWPLYFFGSGVATILEGDPGVMELAGMDELASLFARKAGFDLESLIKGEIRRELVQEREWKEEDADVRIGEIRWVKRRDYDEKR